jgi:hypothetical protein
MRKMEKLAETKTITTKKTGEKDTIKSTMKIAKK